MSYTELVAELRGHAERFNYDGWIDTAIWFEQAADAIEALQKDLERSKEYEAFWQKEATEALKKFQVAVASKPRWIPVTEKPPLKVGDDGYNGYLVYANGYYEVADYTTDKLDDVQYFYVDGEYEPDVTHWMPLPEPPREEEK